MRIFNIKHQNDTLLPMVIFPCILLINTKPPSLLRYTFFCDNLLVLPLLGELTISSVGRTIENEITRIENVRHANKNIDSATL